MRIKTALASLIILIAQAGYIKANAWNDFGHMTVAYVAYKHLNPQTKSRVDALLKLNPYYAQWKSQLGQNISDDERNAEIFMFAATWPDLIKRDAKYISDGDSDGNRPVGPGATQNSGYSDMQMHKYWHFYDQPFAVDKSKLPAIPNPNALTQIAAFRKVIASNAPDELKSYDLTWLMHMVGDVHQPMHCATRVSKYFPYGDNGGNDVLLNYKGLNYKLHGFWDGALGTGGAESVMKFADSLKPAKASMAAKGNEKTWAKESFQLSQKKVYVAPIKWGNGPFEMTNSYEESAVGTAKERVELAGERLANLLNQELK